MKRSISFIKTTALGGLLVIFGIALLSLVGLCFATGLFVRTRLGDAAKHWVGRIRADGPGSNGRQSVHRVE